MVVEIITWVDTRYYWDRNNPNKKYCSIQLSNPELTDFRYLSDSDLLPKVGTIVVVDLSNKIAQPLPENPDWEKVWDVLLDKENSIFVLPNNLQQNFYKTFEDILKKKIHDINSQCNIIHNLLRLDSLSDEAKDFFQKVLKRIEEEQKKRNDFLSSVKQASIIFDIEGNQIGRTWEYAYKLGDDENVVSHERTYLKSGALKYLSPIDWTDFYMAIKDRDIVIGHNIKEWDCKMILERFEVSPIVINHDRIWDTLEVEILLHPERKYFGLNAEKGHIAKNDVIAAEKLFWNQVAELLIDKNTYDSVVSALPKVFKELVKKYQEYVFGAPICSLLKPLTTPQEDILYTSSSPRRIIQNADIIPGEKTLIVASKEDWGEISRDLGSKVEFIFKGDSSQLLEYNALDLSSLSQLKDDEDICKKALGLRAQKLMNYGRSMRLCELPGLFRTRLKDAFLRTYIKQKSNGAEVQCIEPHNIEAIHWEPEKIILYHVNGFPKEISCHRDLFEFAIALSDYSEYRKTFSLTQGQAKILAEDEFCKDANYWLYQPCPKEFHLLYSISLGTLTKFFRDKYHYARIVERTFSFTGDSHVVGYLSENSFPTNDNISSEEGRISYWKQQLTLFDSILSDNGPKVFILASDSEKNDIAKHYKTIGKKVFFSGKKHPYEVLDKLCENTDCIGVMSLKDLLDGEKITFPTGFTFVLNSLAFCDNLSPNIVKDIVFDISNRLSAYSISNSPSSLYIIDSRIERCGIGINKVQINSSLSPECEESIRRNIIHSKKKLLEEADFENVVKWIEKTWAIPQHEEEVKDGIVLEPQGRLYSIQKQAIKRVIEYRGDNNTFLTIMPTGMGKSVIFQGPLMYKRKNSNRLSIVITPLQALMKNQVEDLRHKLIENEVRTGKSIKSLFENLEDDKLNKAIDKLVKGETLPFYLSSKQTSKLIVLNNKYKEQIAYINSSTTAENNKQIWEAIKKKKLALLYIAPERLMYRSFYNAIKNVAFEPGIDSIIFDEAHCITGWGMEFRPDYVLAARKCKDIQRIYPEVSIQLFTATLPEQAKKDLFKILYVDDCNILPKPGTEDFISSLCPIRDHIDITFVEAQDSLPTKDEDTIPEGKIKKVDELLREKTLYDNLCEGNSRAIVFTKRRDDAEECARRLNNKFKDSPLDNKIDYFHAGRSKKKKEDIIKKYESGEIIVLCSTKAFGLGMNIGNIHSVIHLTPPSFIEDYLQEVGRAGRNMEAFKKVFGESEKIQATCLYVPNDMERTVQQLKDDELSWEHIKSAFNDGILGYKKVFGKNEDHTLVVPLNLSKGFHQCLGWLSDIEGLNRIGLLFRSPYSYQLKVMTDDQTGISNSSQLYSLVTYIKSIEETNTIVDGIVRVDANCVLEKTKNIRDINELEKVIGEGVALGVLSRDSMYVNVSLRKSIIDEVLRMKDNENYFIPHLSLLCDLLCGEYSSNDLSRESSRIYKQINENIPYFQSMSLIYSIDEIKNNCRQLLIAIMECGNNSITWAAVKKAVNANEDPRKADIFIMALSVLKLINLGDTCSDYIEIEIINSEPIDDENDKTVKKELECFNQNRILKNDSMYAMIDSYIDSESTKDFIRQYSAFGDDNLNDFEPVAKYSARISLEKAIENGTILNDEQREIYNLPNNKEVISVSAGAGSGKTRLLIYRALKLILCQPGVDESEVLVLAYNRAVADEVSKRMDEYANDIHYVLRNKSIYTFHGFACRHLPQLLKEKIKFDKWEALLLDDILAHPSSYKKYRHILIDESQDVTSTRLRIIRELIKINNATAFEIGDMYQSIYGYEKKADVKKRLFDKGIEFIKDFAIIKPDKQNEFQNKLQDGGDIWEGIKACVSIDPSDYHLKDTAVKRLELKNNYRSYQAIINTSVRWFEGSPLEKPYLTSQVYDSFEPPVDSCICPMPGNDWIKDLAETILPKFLLNRETWEKEFKHDDKQINPFTTLCILFRTNSDVHDAYSKLKQLELPGNPEVIIHGSDIFYQFTREFYFFSSFLEKKTSNSIIEDDSFMAEYKNTDANDDDFVLEVAKQTASIIIKNNPGLTYAKLYEEFVRITSEERNRLKEYVDKQLDSGNKKCRIILSTIHRVKGMEYDAVVVPASTYPIDLDYDDMTAEESNLEERRLMYVAFSRAKRMLYYYKGEREKAILKNDSYKGAQDKFYASDGLSAVDISFAAQGDDDIQYYDNVPNNSFFNINEYINNNVKTGAPLVLRRKDNSGLRNWQMRYRPGETLEPDDWCIYHDGTLIGRLSSKNKLRKKMNETKFQVFSGLFVKAICVCKYNEADENDENANKRQWCEKAIKQGFVYYVDYYGCAKPDNAE